VLLKKLLPKRNKARNVVNPKETVNHMISIKICLNTFCILGCPIALQLTVRLGDVVAFENRLPVTAAKFIYKCSLFILLTGVTRHAQTEGA
jgi:hypothetical protein